MARDSGLAVIDVTHPEKLALIALYPLRGPVSDLATDDENVYFTDMSRGLVRINAKAEEAEPQLVVPLLKPWRVTLAGRRMVVATISGTLHLFELTREGVKAVGVISAPSDDRGDVRGVALTERSLAVALNDRSFMNFPLSDWPGLAQSTRLELPGMPFSMVTADGEDAVYTGLVAGGVAKIDVSNPLEPRLAGHLLRPTTFLSMASHNGSLYTSIQTGRKGFAAFSLESIEGLRVDSGRLVADNFFAFREWNGSLYGYTRDKNLVELGTTGHSGQPVSGPLLMVSDNHGVGIFTRGAGGALSRAGSLVDAGWSQRALAADGVIYLLHRQGLRVLAGDELTKMAVAGALEISGRPSHIKFLTPGYLLVTTRDEGLKVVDVADHTRPQIVAALQPLRHLRSTNTSHDVFLLNDVAYVSQGTGGVYVVDLSEPLQPHLLQVIDTPGVAMKFALHDELLLVTVGNEGVFMIDVSDPFQPLAVGTLPTPMRASEIAAVADGFLISSYPAGNTMKIPYPREIDDLEVMDTEQLQLEIPGDAISGYAYFYDGRSMSRLSLVETGR